MKPIYLSRSIIVGLFILIGVIIFASAVFTIGSQQKAFEKTVPVKAIFDDVNGLHIGNNVWLSGVKIGTVKKMRFLESASVEVTMNIDQQSSIQIKKDAKAKIGTDGLIGNRIVVIYGGNHSSPGISSGNILETEKSAGTDDMISTLRLSNNNIAAITEDLKYLSNKIRNGKGSLGELINDDAIANNLKFATLRVKSAAIKAEESIAKLDEFLSGLKKEGSLPNELMSDTTVYSDFKAAISQFREAAVNISHAAVQIDEVSHSLSRTDNAFGTMLNDKQVAEEIKTIIKNLNSSSKKLDEDLEAAQHNFLLKSYFKKQEKDQKKKVEAQEKTE
ncbi:MAG: MlaD family protein [Chitinophagales bacterium]